MRIRCRAALLLLTALVAALCGAQAALAANRGWHAPGEEEVETPRPNAFDKDSRASSDVRRASAHVEKTEEGPALPAPTGKRIVSHVEPTAGEPEADPTIHFDPLAAVKSRTAGRRVDNWAEEIMSRRQRRFERASAGVLPASHNSRTAMRTMAPSAFSGDQPTIRSMPTAAGPALVEPGLVTPSLAEEELPAMSSQASEELPTPANPDEFLGGEPPADFEMHGPHGDYIEGPGPEGHGHGGCDSCGGCGGCRSCRRYNYWENLSVFGGVHAFKGPVDQGRNGNFGFHEGVNWGAPIWRAGRLGYQVGGQVVHSNFSGSDVIVPTSASRTQYFITTGVFQRAICGSPWQWGAAYDWLSDNYYVNQQLAKLRVEASFVGSMGDEVGFWSSLRLQDSTARPAFNSSVQALTWTPTDLYAFFYRRHFCTGAWGRLWGGFTGSSDTQGMIGGDFQTPLSSALAVQANFNYLVPAQSPNNGGASQESWALSINLVWYPGLGSFSGSCSPWRPLFNVADNSLFFLKSR